MGRNDMTDRQTVGIGIVGAGFLAETRARCYGRIGTARLAAVASLRAERAQAYAVRHDVPVVCKDLDELLAEEAKGKKQYHLGECPIQGLIKTKKHWLA